MRLLQLAGILVAALVLLFWPGLTLGTFMFTAAIAVLWVGGIEFLVGSA